jgi:hypothetical protein
MPDLESFMKSSKVFSFSCFSAWFGFMKFEIKLSLKVFGFGFSA